MIFFGKTGIRFSGSCFEPENPKICALPEICC
jgi:hypothetical protein